MVVREIDGGVWTKVVYFTIGNKQIMFRLNERNRGKMRRQTVGDGLFLVPSESNTELNDGEKRVIISNILGDVMGWFRA